MLQYCYFEILMENQTAFLAREKEEVVRRTLKDNLGLRGRKKTSSKKEKLENSGYSNIRVTYCFIMLISPRFSPLLIYHTGCSPRNPKLVMGSSAKIE